MKDYRYSLTGESNMQDAADFVPGTIVQHFKRTMLSAEELAKQPLMYLYEIIGCAMDTETEEDVMVYRALYGSRQIYVRPMVMFISAVDHQKYPGVKQEYRFEIVE